MVCSVDLVDLCSDTDDDETVSPPITYEEYLSSKKINSLVQNKVTKEWMKIGEIKSVIEKLLIKHFFVSFYTPVGAMAKVSEWYSIIKVNQSTMTPNYRQIFKDSDDEAKGVAERLSVTSAMDAYCHKKHIMEEVEIERQKVNRRIENINLLDPNLKIPEMKTVVHYITKITKGNLKQFKKAICEYCSHLVVFNNAQTLNSHIFDEHSGYFKEITEKFYYYADQLAEERFKMAVEELKSEIAGQELFVIFLNPSLKAKVEKLMGDMENKRGTKRKVPKVNTSTPHSSTSKNRKIAGENPVVNAVSPTSTSRHQISITSPLPSTSSDYHQSSGPSGYPKFQGQAKKKKEYEGDRLQQSQHDKVPRTAVHPTTVETDLDVGSRTFF